MRYTLHPRRVSCVIVVRYMYLVRACVCAYGGRGCAHWDASIYNVLRILLEGLSHYVCLMVWPFLYAVAGNYRLDSRLLPTALHHGEPRTCTLCNRANQTTPQREKAYVWLVLSCAVNSPVQVPVHSGLTVHA